jgi:type IV pilus assembly protein PilA
MQDIITRLRAKKDDEGFTLIELLVVVVIIGVLVAIAVPVYLNYRKGAADKSAQSDVRGSISAIEQFYTENNNAYPTLVTIQSVASTSTLLTIGNQRITLSDKTLFSYVPVGTTAYKVCATNSGGSGKIYVYDSERGGSVAASTAGTPSMVTCV